MEERRKAETGAFQEQEITFYSELPPRGGVLEYQEVLEDVGLAARLDRADKALDSLVNTEAVLTAQQEDRVAGITVGTVATASLHPPRLTVAIRREHPACGMVLQSGTFAINFLGEGQEGLSERFAAPHDQALGLLAGVEYTRGVSSGAPILQKALGFVECRVAETLECGDHVVIVADLMDGGSLHDGKPLVSIGRYKPTLDISDHLSVGS